MQLNVQYYRALKGRAMTAINFVVYSTNNIAKCKNNYTLYFVDSAVEFLEYCNTFASV